MKEPVRKANKAASDGVFRTFSERAYNLSNRRKDSISGKLPEDWIAMNAGALASSNAYVEKHGLPLAPHRQF